MKPKILKIQAGFTLLELLIVIAIIGVLASVVMLAVQQSRAKSRDAKRAADIRQLVTAMETFFNDAGAYPTGTGYVASGGAQLGSASLSAYGANGHLYNFNPDYLGVLPIAPIPADDPFSSSTCSQSGHGGNNYWYETDNKGSTYTLTFCLGVGAGDLGAGTHYGSPYGIQ